MSTVAIHISLLEEGTPTWKLIQALDLGNGLYKLLPTENYDPEDEIWEFEPGSIVVGQKRHTDTGENILVAARPPVSREAILKAYPNASIIPIHVLLGKTDKKTTKQTDAIALENRLYKLLPTSDYNPQMDIWEFTPGSVVRAVKDTDEFGNEILLAFDQIREDRMNEHYARSVISQAL